MNDDLGATQLRRYPVVTLTIGVGPDDRARWVVSAYAFVIAALEAWSPAKKLLKGHAGPDGPTPSDFHTIRGHEQGNGVV